MAAADDAIARARTLALEQAFRNALRPPPKLSLSEWADTHAILSAESSAEPGRWKTIPYQKGIMDAFTDPRVTYITCMKSARVGWTKILNHVCGYYMHQDPCAIMVVQPTIEDAEGHSKEEIAPMLRDTPVLSGIVTDAKAKDSTNTIAQKLFPGGSLSLIGANSPRGFRRVSRRVVLFDEVDGYPPSAGAEGDQIKLGIRRSEYFWNRKIGAGSTPTIKDASRIERMYEQSDQRRYFVPCPVCGHFQVFWWKNLKWESGHPETAHFVCEAHGCIMTHDKKRWMVERGEWRPTATRDGTHAGFHIWAAYSYSPNASWADLVTEFLEAKDNPETFKTFVNTVLGELWEEAYAAKVGAESIRARAEIYTPSVVPAKAVVLTAGVDVQDNRLSYSVYAWAKDDIPQTGKIDQTPEEAWLIEREEIYGDPAQAEVWKQLDQVLLRKFRHESGGELRVHAAAIDSGGHFTHEVYGYARARRAHWIIAVKGSSQRGKQALGKPTRQDVNFRGQTIKKGVDLYPLGVDTIKTTLYGRLKLGEPGPGYIHYHAGLPKEFFEQLTAEKKSIRYVKGHAFYDWTKKDGARNEALDEAVYAYAALQLLYTKHSRKTMFKQYEKKLGLQGVKVEPKAEEPGSIEAALSPPDQPAEEKPEDPGLRVVKQRRMMLRPKRGGFVGGFRS